MTTIAEKLAALSLTADAFGFVSAEAAAQSGFFTEDAKNREEFGDVSPFNIAMELRGRVALVNGVSVPNLEDFRGQHYLMKDGSWIMFVNGTQGQVSDGQSAGFDTE